MAKRHTVKYELDESGWWVATVRGLAGVHTQARTIASARERIREALEAAGENGKAEIIDQVKLPAEVKRGVELALRARADADKSQTRAQLAMRAAAGVLTKSLGLSVRDAATLLRLSHQRVQQLVE